MTCTKAEWSALKTAVALANAANEHIMDMKHKTELDDAWKTLATATITDYDALQTPGEIVEAEAKA